MARVETGLNASVVVLRLSFAGKVMQSPAAMGNGVAMSKISGLYAAPIVLLWLSVLPLSNAAGGEGSWWF